MRRRVPKALVVWLAATPLAAAHPAAPPSSPRPSAASSADACQIVEIGSAQAPHARTRFSATRIVELEFDARLERRTSREHTLRLRVYTPQGFLYQVLTVPPESSGPALPTVPVEKDRSGGRSDQKPARLAARLPVAGTSIMASGLYGRWKVVPYLDDGPRPCGPGRSFVIQP